jgi:2-polyprenyl-3-methyl-5-hydroxy-6-metoxy-1,4-benzoquinol methylase
MNNRIRIIREEERKYHEACYDNNKLFETGSWLSKPVKTVMDTLSYFNTNDKLSVLDLGCGVGRNSIPIADTFKARTGRVICVDLIESALIKLLDYSQQHGVSEYIETKLSDIGNYIIEDKGFDYIIAVSALEHVESEHKFIEVLERMARGTRDNGINCIIMNTNIEEIDIETGTQLIPLMELNMTTNHAEQLLASAYQGWEIKFTTLKALQFNIERNNRKVLLKSDCFTYVVQKTC